MDPDKFVSLVESLYEDNSYIDALFAGLSNDGVVSRLQLFAEYYCIDRITFIVLLGILFPFSSLSSWVSLLIANRLPKIQARAKRKHTW